MTRVPKAQEDFLISQNTAWFALVDLSDEKIDEIVKYVKEKREFCQRLRAANMDVHEAIRTRMRLALYR